MSELPTCVYCGVVVDATKPYWILERWVFAVSWNPSPSLGAGWLL